MEGFVEDLIVHCDVNGSAATPANNALFESELTDDALEEKERKRFHSVAAKLLYLSKRVRPDIATAVAYLTTRVTIATIRDRSKLNRVMNYVRSTKDECIEFDSRNSDKKHSLEAFIDASFAVHEDGRSHSGMVLKFAGSTILVRSTKQKINSESSTEAELVSLSDNLRYALRAHDFITGQGYDVGPIMVYQDNQSVLAMLKRPDAAPDRNKNMKVRRIKVRDLIKDNEIEIHYMPTDQMLADTMTKQLQGMKFRSMRDSILRGAELARGGV